MAARGVRVVAAGAEGGVTRRGLLRGAAAAAVGLGVLPARAGARALPPAAAYGAEVPAAWFDLALELVRTTPGFSPPVASRAFGYTGVALREALAPGLPDRRSLAGRLNALAPPRPPADVAYHWPTVANGALATVLRAVFPTASPDMAAAVDDLEWRFATTAQAMLGPGVYRRSAARGAEVARHVFDWSTTDGGHEGFLRNFPPYVPPAGPGLWVPTAPAFMPALQPFWGSNRPFALTAAELDWPDSPPAYSEQPGSPFHAEAKECYQVAAGLTPEQETIARFWADDPGQTATPPGHSISLVNQLVRAHDLPLARAADAYARVGIAIADAFVACWHTKYIHNLLRPVTYVNAVIDPGWTPLLNTPPFPEYTSGHSVQSAAAARVMTDLFGHVTFTDHTHDRLGLPARSFASFADAATEAAISRLYGGIHFRTAIEHGLEQGDRIGSLVTRRLS